LTWKPAASDGSSWRQAQQKCVDLLTNTVVCEHPL
jgi:hypothetical protein